MQAENIRNFTDLEAFLENWTTFHGDPHVYDVIGLLTLIRACLRNLEKYSIAGDFEELYEVFEENEIVILEKLVAGTRRSG